MGQLNIIGLLDMDDLDYSRRVYGVDGIAPTLTTSQGGNRQPKVVLKGDNGGMVDLKVNDLFCGAGGMGLGFKQAGFKIEGAIDFDKFAVETYKHNIGDHVEQADITKMQWDDLPYADVWAFGFPCQDLSVAGKRKGLFKGKRSGLFFEVMRLLDETRENEFSRLPSIILAENVKGLKKYLPVLEEEYADRGYKMYYTLFNSKYWGVPQNRERYFVVGVHESIEKEFIFPVQQEHYIPRLHTILEPVVDEKYYINPERTKSVIEQAKENERFNKEQGIVPYPTVMDGSAVCCTARYFKGTTPKMMAKGHDTHVIEDWARVRKLTPREYARLQGFPEDFEQVVSNSQFYKQMGNAVTVNVAQAIAERIKMFLLSL